MVSAQVLTVDEVLAKIEHGVAGVPTAGAAIPPGGGRLLPVGPNELHVNGLY
jgi:hypothetical protein